MQKVHRATARQYSALSGSPQPRISKYLFSELLLNGSGRRSWEPARLASWAGRFGIGCHQRSRHSKGSEQQGGSKPFQVLFHGKVPFQGELHRDNVLVSAFVHRAR